MKNQYQVLSRVDQRQLDRKRNSTQTHVNRTSVARSRSLLCFCEVNQRFVPLYSEVYSCLFGSLLPAWTPSDMKRLTASGDKWAKYGNKDDWEWERESGSWSLRWGMNPRLSVRFYRLFFGSDLKSHLKCVTCANKRKCFQVASLLSRRLDFISLTCEVHRAGCEIWRCWWTLTRPPLLPQLCETHPELSGRPLQHGQSSFQQQEVLHANTDRQGGGGSGLWVSRSMGPLNIYAQKSRGLSFPLHEIHMRGDDSDCVLFMK